MMKAISFKQLMYSVSAFVIASNLLTSNLYYIAKNDSWISVLIAVAASLVIIAIYSALAKRYPGKSLQEISEAVFGRSIGKAVSVLYIFYFLSLAYFNTRDLGDFVKGMLLPGTPIMLIIIVFLVICAWAVRKGPVVMTRYGFISTLIVVTAILLNAMLLLNKSEPRNLLPVFTLPVKNYLIGAHIVTMLPFCEIMTFMTIIPYLDKPESFGRAMRNGLFIGAATLLLVVMIDITVLQGIFTGFHSMPTFSSIKLIDVGDVLTRLEVVYAVILMMMLFFKVGIVYYATVSGISRLFNIGSHQSFIFILGGIIAVYAAASFSAMAEHVEWNLTAAATYSSFFLLVLPAVTLVVASLRGRYNSETAAGRNTG